MKEILNGSFYSATDAVRLGLVDKIQTFEEFKENNFPGHRVIEHKMDPFDDFDLSALEMANGRFKGLSNVSTDASADIIETLVDPEVLSKVNLDNFEQLSDILAHHELSRGLSHPGL
jgi:ClpP class serine protease